MVARKALASVSVGEEALTAERGELQQGYLQSWL